MHSLTQEDIEALIAALPGMSPKEQEALLTDLERVAEDKRRQTARDDFLAFCHYVCFGFLEGAHHRFMKPILHRVRDGTEIRVTISMPPRFGKSYSIAYLFVAWYLGHNPTHQIIMVTHTATLSESFGRQVRDLLDTTAYRELFPDTVVAKDKAAAGNWMTTVGGKYLAIGIGANVAGHGAHLLIADDLVSENAVMANPDTAFENAWKYMQVGPLQRLMPGGRIIMIGCMTAETGVLMADGSEKEIRHIKVGDVVATYDAGKITTSRITNWIEHPSDFVYKIRTSSGRIVRANKRHPFLVDRNGARTWVRVRDLKVGDCLVEAVQQKGACDHTKPRGCVVSATSESCGLTEKSEHNATLGIGESGKALSAPPRGVVSRSLQKDCAKVATARKYGGMGRIALLLSKSAKAILNTGMAFLRKFTTRCSQNKAGFAQFVSSPQQQGTQGQDRCQNYTLTTATTPRRSGGFCATTATWQSAGEKHQTCLKPPLGTCATTPSAIVEIVEDGFEAVFDMEVERTENFIANGVVSHNTRWGKKDPIGKALAWAEDNPSSPQWLEVRFPAILPSGRSLWPEQWPVEQLEAKRASMLGQFWAAQYMQSPTNEEGALIKREWWKVWKQDLPPDVEFVIQTWDTAHEAKNYADYSACTTWGIWEDEDKVSNIILLDAVRGRWEFPELKKKVLEKWKQWDPEALIVEKKAAGAPLIQELRRMNVVVQEISPSRGSRGMSNDKRARMNAIAGVFEAGRVWVPDKRWAWEVVDEVAEFPFGENDDRADCTQMAIARYRTGGFISTPTDYDEDAPGAGLTRRQKAYY